MEAIVCKACGAGGLRLVNGRGQCEYCGTVFILDIISDLKIIRKLKFIAIYVY